MKPPLRLDDLVRVLRSLERLNVVLVGGQAVNYWAARYLNTAPDLAPEQPYTSKDVDFYGTARDAVQCAALIHGKMHAATLDDATPNSAVVTFVDSDGHTREIDFLRVVAGVKDSDLRKSVVRVPVETDDGNAVNVAVMNPILCIESRVYNVVRLSGEYDNEHGLKQLRAAIVCGWEFITEAVSAGHSRKALDYSERVFRFAKNRLGLTVYRTKGIDCFAAVQPHTELGQKFVTIRYPQMVRILEHERR